MNHGELCGWQQAEGRARLGAGAAASPDGRPGRNQVGNGDQRESEDPEGQFQCLL